MVLRCAKEKGKPGNGEEWDGQERAWERAEDERGGRDKTRRKKLTYQ